MEKKKEEYEVVRYPRLIVLSEKTSKTENLDLTIVNDKLGMECSTILNLLEVIIYKQKKRHLFGIKKLNPIVNYNPNTMNEKQYEDTIQKALKILKVI
jgi:hypothetical protein